MTFEESVKRWLDEQQRRLETARGWLDDIDVDDLTHENYLRIARAKDHIRTVTQAVDEMKRCPFL